MNAEFSRCRRFAVAFAAIACAAVLLRTQIAEAMVIRGDDCLYRGQTLRALEHYRRAVTIAPLLEAAADRYVFLSVQMHTPASLASGISVANAYLSVRSSDAALLSDRALCYLHERRYELAQADFERAARASASATSYVFAGWAAERSGSANTARLLWKAALRIDPRNVSALAALAEHEK